MIKVNNNLTSEGNEMKIPDFIKDDFINAVIGWNSVEDLKGYIEDLNFDIKNNSLFDSQFIKEVESNISIVNNRINELIK